jgi:hypothetical protein
LSETPLKWVVDVADPEQYEGRVLDPITAIAHMPEFPTIPGCWLCGFCDWSHCCPSVGEVYHLVNQTAEDALLAWTLREHAESVAGMVTARRAALKKQLDAWVDQHGAIDLGDGRSYGPQKKATVKVKSLKSLLQEAAARDRDVAFALQVNSKRRHDLAKYVGMSDPFADAEADSEPWESVVVSLKTVNEVIYPEPEQPSFAEDEEFAEVE